MTPRDTLRDALLLLATLLLMLGTAHTPAVASCDQIDPLIVLPADEACPGWTRDGDPMTAYNIEELTLIINGEAYFYEQYGFVAAAFQNYAGEVGGEPAAMTLAAFNQGTAANAAALYHDSNSGSGDPVADWDGCGEARVRVAFGFVTFQFWEACFFVSIVITSGGEQGVPDAHCMASQVVGLIEEPSPAKTQTWGNIKALYQ